ncbi:MAG: hypothetical protein ABIR84_11450 [Candidatus Nitrotoga sp.]
MMSIFGKVESTLGFRVGGVKISQDGIDSAELLQLGTLPEPPSVAVRSTLTRDCDSLDTPQTIGHYPRRRGPRRFRPLGNCFLGEFQLLQANPHRLACLHHMHGSNERNLGNGC